MAMVKIKGHRLNTFGRRKARRLGRMAARMLAQAGVFGPVVVKTYLDYDEAGMGKTTTVVRTGRWVLRPIVEDYNYHWADLRDNCYPVSRAVG